MPIATDLPQTPLSRRLAIGFSKISIALRHRAWQEGSARDLTPTQGQALVSIHRQAGISLAAVAAGLGVRASTASEAISVLVRKGWVEKRRSLEDRRTLELHLTTEGSQEATRAEGWPEFLASAIETLPPEEAETLMKALQRMIRELQQRGEIPVARMCNGCTFFRPFSHPETALPHHCAFVDTAFGNADLRLDCPDHQPAAEGQALTL
ncbi:MAG: MarR family winged helix-turn-helix transcriptional regulator [Deltaproteobacteria bacterium]|nr:MarR family winged helix-turn-helix transcriptional regulator [Deltaproteobacteria bacterium]